MMFPLPVLQLSKFCPPSLSVVLCNVSIFSFLFFFSLKLFIFESYILEMSCIGFSSKIVNTYFCLVQVISNSGMMTLLHLNNIIVSKF